MNARVNSRIIIEVGIFVALSLILNLIVVFKMPNGGSVSLEALPLIILSIRRGIIIGIIVGIIFGFVALLFGASIFHPVQMLIDYPIAYGLIGLSGVVSSSFQWAIKNHKSSVFQSILIFLLVFIERLVMHSISGVIFFANYAPKNENVILYSIIYNATFLIPAIAISVLIIYFLSINQYASKIFIVK